MTETASTAVPRLEITATPDPGDPAAAGWQILQAWHDTTGRLVATGGHDGTSWWMHWPGLGTYWFGIHGPVRVTPSALDLDEPLRDHFLRGVIPVVMQVRGCDALHASAVADDLGVVALCGVSGTGKSTIAFGLAQCGLAHWADDTLVYHLRSARPLALPLPFAARVAGGVANRASSGVARRDEAVDRALRRIYLLSRDSALDPERPMISPVGLEARFERLLAHAYPFDLDGEGGRRRYIETVLAVCARVDVWECRFAPSIPALPQLCRALGEHVARA